MNSPALPLALYLLATLLLGLWVNRRATSNLDEFYLAGRSLGGFVLAMTLVTTYTSASSFIGGPGVASQLGLGWVYLAMIQVPTAWVTLAVLGKRFAILSRRTGCLTVTSFLRERYESPLLAALASLALMIFFIAAMTAQFVGGGRLFQAATGLSYPLSLGLFAFTVILYTAWGGARAVALTDTLQGLVMMAGTILLLAAAAKAGGGWGATFQKVGAIDPALLTPHGPGGKISWPMLSSFWILVCFGVVGLPHTASRCLTYRDSKAMHRAMIYSTVVLTLILFGMTTVGVFSRALLEGNIPGDLMMPTLAGKLLPPWAAGVFLAGPLASMMSTLDSQLLQMAATVTQDLSKLGRDPMGLSARKWAPRITFALGVIVFLFALKPPSLLVWLNLFAFGGLEAVFFWPLVLGLYWKKGDKTAALASMIAGLGGYALGHFLPLGGAHAILPAFFLSGIVYIGIGIRGQGPSDSVMKTFFTDR